MISTYQKFSLLIILALFVASSPSGRSEALSEEKAKVAENRRSAGSGKKHEKAMRKIADLQQELALRTADNEQLKLRIEAGNRAGADLEQQLAECLKAHESSAQLKRDLAEARALAEREHERAEMISAQILKQVDAQKAIARRLKETIALIEEEREELLAKLAAQPKFGQEEKQRLLAENEKLSRSLKEAWEKAKANERAQADKQQEMAELRKKATSLDSIEERMRHAISDQQELKETAERASAQLQSTLDAQLRLQNRVEELEAQIAKAEEKAIAQRAEALRERIIRKKLETQLEDTAQAAEEAAEAKARAKLLDIAPIYFGKNQAESEAQEASLLAQVAEIHQAYPDARFNITGYTCTDGTASRNLALSQQRAQRVAELLTNNGIPAAAIAGVDGKGEANPLADNSTRQGREANRRVEIKVLLE